MGNDTIEKFKKKKKKKKPEIGSFGHSHYILYFFIRFYWKEISRLKSSRLTFEDNLVFCIS